MTSVLDEELMTIAEAAARLKVSKVTISRWIKAGRLPATQVGARTVRIRTEDLSRIIHAAEQPKRPRLGPVYVRGKVYADISEVPPMTEEEKHEKLEWARRAAELRESIKARRNGVPVPSTTEIIRAMRLDRAEHLGNL